MDALESTLQQTGAPAISSQDLLGSEDSKNVRLLSHAELAECLLAMLLPFRKLYWCTALVSLCPSYACCFGCIRSFVMTRSGCCGHAHLTGCLVFAFSL